MICTLKLDIGHPMWSASHAWPVDPGQVAMGCHAECNVPSSGLVITVMCLESCWTTPAYVGATLDIYVESRLGCVLWVYLDICTYIHSMLLLGPVHVPSSRVNLTCPDPESRLTLNVLPVLLEPRLIRWTLCIAIGPPHLDICTYGTYCFVQPRVSGNQSCGTFDCTIQQSELKRASSHTWPWTAPVC